MIRSAADEPSYVYSRIGLYIPRDGDQTIAMPGTATDAISYITPLQIHPEYVVATDFPAAQQYAIPVHDDPQPVSVHIPFRSTLKKLQTRWVGELKGGIGGSVRLIAFNVTIKKGDPKHGEITKKGVIAGNLVNNTGEDQKEIYVAFNYVQSDGAEDHVLFIPSWQAGKTLDLNAEYNSASPSRASAPVTMGVRSKARSEGSPGGRQDDREDWSGGGIVGNDAQVADFDTDVPRGFPIMSLFDRIRQGRRQTSHRLYASRRIDSEYVRRDRSRESWSSWPNPPTMSARFRFP